MAAQYFRFEKGPPQRHRTMHDSIEADLLVAHLLPFARDREAWTDAYVTARSRADPSAVPERVERAAGAAWRSHGWAHPAVVAHLEHALGSLDDD
jgi:hypothetical protein